IVHLSVELYTAGGSFGSTAYDCANELDKGKNVPLTSCASNMPVTSWLPPTNRSWIFRWRRAFAIRAISPERSSAPSAPLPPNIVNPSAELDVSSSLFLNSFTLITFKQPWLKSPKTFPLLGRCNPRSALQEGQGLQATFLSQAIQSFSLAAIM